MPIFVDSLRIRPDAVHWATDYEGIGNSYGYSVHNAKSREAIRKAGVRIDPGAPVAFHVAPAHLFKPIPGKVNVLYMAWETDALPSAHYDGLASADAVIATASFLVDIVRQRFPKKPVFLCHEGVDIDQYTYRRRKRPVGKPFRFLWIGAPNARKGWELVLSAWAPFVDEGRVELYLKTTITNRFERYRNVVFDSRNLPQDELTDLYHSAHAFVFPSFGEGFGLTLAEAMATGLAALYTPWSSLTDLADETCGYPLRFRLLPAWVTPEGGLSTETQRPCGRAVRTRLAQADPDDLAEQMMHVVQDYSEAALRGVHAAERIRNRFTWDHTGARLADILKEVSGTCQPAPTCVRATA